PMQPPEFMRVWRSGLEGTTQLVLPDGDHRILGFSPVPEFGWTIVVGISAVQLTAPAWHAAMITSAVGLGLLLVGGALAQLISRSVIGPISKLARFASAAENGDVPKPVGTGLRETDEVAAILLSDVRARDAAMATQARDAGALKRSNKALTDEIARREGAQAALRAAKAVADEASHARSRFLTNITHELRTPLHGILGYAELLGLEGGLNPTQSARVASMIAAGEHLLGMINAVLDVSQIEAGRLELNPVEIDLADLAAACLDVVRPKAEAKGLALAMTVTTPGRVSADVTRLRQVLINLLGNAIKFTASGKVDLRLTRTAAGNGVRLEVVDTGPGIWARHRDKLFRAFERLNAHAVEGIEGTGLGLALAAQFVRAMDGRIGYTDNPGGGSIFWVELPAIPEGPAVPNVAVASNRDTSLGVRLLVVDDDALNREIASRFLTLGGHEVVCLDNGFAAVEAAKTQGFDAILMDVRMPGMNGLEATRLIRMLPGPRGVVPVIALTAQAFAEQIEICRAAGMNAHVSKPFSQETLLAAVAEMVPTRAAMAPVALPPNPTDGADPEHPVFERATFEEAIEFLAPAEAADYLRTLIARGEALACDLRADELRSGADALADAAHKFAGAAAMLGFLSLADIGRRFEFAADSGAPEMQALADPLAAAVATALAIMQQKLGEMAVSAMD
ncbi:MAG TPA: ATP-binding protein, partial [Acetobacteraceae bacterium]|nr:ATP-binding protein [Acetobacteraceae bacterium]